MQNILCVIMLFAYSSFVDFTSFLKTTDLERLAEADARYQVLKDLQEFYGDSFVLGERHFSLQIPNLIGEQIGAWQPKALKRCANGLTSVLLALKTHPIIRFDNTSPMATALAHQVKEVIQGERSLFDFRHHSTLLIVDRRSDMLTPLMLPWTYQAMLHEMFEITNGRVLEKHNLADHQGDQFWRENKSVSYGHLGQRVQEMTRRYKAKQEQTSKMTSVSEMRRFISEYSEFRSMAMHVEKHVELVGEIRTRVEQEKWMEVSEVEQGIACHDSPAGHFKTLSTILASDITPEHKQRLAILYAIKYARQSSANMPELIDLMRRCNFSADSISVQKTCLSHSSPVPPF